MPAICCCFLRNARCLALRVLGGSGSRACERVCAVSAKRVPLTEGPRPYPSDSRRGAFEELQGRNRPGVCRKPDFCRWSADLKAPPGWSRQKCGLRPSVLFLVNTARNGSRKMKKLCAAFVIAVFIAPLGAEQTAAKKPITHDVYDGWRSIQGTKISRDGIWLAYALVPQDGDGELVVRNLKTTTDYRAPRGRDPIITPDGKFVVFEKAPLKADVDKARKAKRNRKRCRSLASASSICPSGQVTTLAEHVKSFRSLRIRSGSSHFWPSRRPPRADVQDRAGSAGRAGGAGGKGKGEETRSRHRSRRS